MSGRPKDPLDFWSSILASRLSDLGLLSQPSDIRSDDVRRQALDDEIAAMSVTLSGLKERRNRSHPSPKLKFPQELLEHIFAYAALNEVPGQGRKEALKPLSSLDVRGVESRIYEILGWVKVTHVCRLWRAIALANGNRWLWSTMDTGRLSAEGMCELLDRSHPHPVTVNFTLSHPDEIDVFDVMFEPEYMSRLKSLQMVADERTTSKDLNGGQDMLAHATDILSSLTDAAASLESLSVAVLYDDEDGTYRPFTLPHIGFLHNLHCLTLKNAEFWLSRDAPVFPQLTHLDITIEPFYGGTSEPLNDFVEFLRGSPHLQVLRLIGSVPKQYTMRQDLNEEDVGAMGVDLVCLRELHLKTSRLDECCALGEYLNIPRTCAITIDARIERPVFGKSAFLKVGPLLQQWAESFLRLDVSFESPILSIQVSSKDKKAVVPDSPPRLHLILDLSHDVNQDPNSGVMKDVSSCKEKWMALFQGIKVLVIRCPTVESAAAVQGLVSALHPSISNHVWMRVFKGPSPSFPLLPFPDLTVLRIWCVKPSVLKIHDLRSCLEARRDKGLSNVLDIEFMFSDGMLPSARFEASLAELEGLATYRIIIEENA